MTQHEANIDQKLNRIIEILEGIALELSIYQQWRKEQDSYPRAVTVMEHRRG